MAILKLVIFGQIRADWTKYNYNTKTGKLEKVTGKSNRQFLESEYVDILEDHLVAHRASMSRCNAQGTKCQHITAERVDIWPNDKMIAYNASVYILGTKLITRSRYVVSLDENKDKQIPRIGYDDDDGVYIAQSFIFPLDNKTSVGADLYAATDLGGRSLLWINQRETNFNARYSYGYTQDDDSNWINKEHNLRVDYHSKRLFKLPWQYRLWYERGFWTDRYKESWHTEVGIYFSRDIINLTSGKRPLTLGLGAGYRFLKESYIDLQQDEYRYDITLAKSISKKWSVSTTYSNVSNNISLFEYNAVNVAESLNTSVYWKPDRLNTFVYFQEYDLENKRLYKHRMTYIRNLHCWDFTLYFENERPIGQEATDKIGWEIHLAI